jgi:(p)ppGpp synthase/HD superfamily hydrolase
MTRMTNTSMIASAYEIAGRVHSGERRKGNGEPYVNHPMRVAKMVSDSIDSPEATAAAVLHDVFENVKSSELKSLKMEVLESCGKRVFDLVSGVTDGNDIAHLPRLERKTIQANRYATAEHEIKIIKMSDQIDNIETLPEVKDAKSEEFARSLATCSIIVVRACADADPELAARAEDSYMKVIENLDRTVETEVPCL